MSESPYFKRVYDLSVGIHPLHVESGVRSICDLIERAIAAEREACAEVAEDLSKCTVIDSSRIDARAIAAAIRARGEK